MNPTIEGIVFVIGIVASFLIRFFGHQSKDWETDASEKHFNFWSLAPIAFIIATATVYDKSNIQNHWFFGFDGFKIFIFCATNFFFGLTFGFLIILIFVETKLQSNAIIENLKKRAKSFKSKIDAKNHITPSLWDRFTPESQMKYLESFLSQLSNQTDKESLEFWKNRQNETEKGGYTFRISLGNEELRKLNFTTIAEKDYLAIEFWKTKDGKFKARTTSGSHDSPKKFTEPTDDQLNELNPHLENWYRELK